MIEAVSDCGCAEEKRNKCSKVACTNPNTKKSLAFERRRRLFLVHRKQDKWILSIKRTVGEEAKAQYIWRGSGMEDKHIRNYQQHF